jgi:hypothetical protein
MQERTNIMRTIPKAGLALGFVGAMALAYTAPAMAQGIYLNGPGIHIGVGGPGYYRHDQGPRYYDYSPGYPGYAGGGGETYNGCPPHYTIQDGVCKPYRGY